MLIVSSDLQDFLDGRIFDPEILATNIDSAIGEVAEDAVFAARARSLLPMKYQSGISSKKNRRDNSYSIMNRWIPLWSEGTLPRWTHSGKSRGEIKGTTFFESAVDPILNTLDDKINLAVQRSLVI